MGESGAEAKAPGPSVLHGPPTGAKRPWRVVPASEGNEARREGRSGVGAFHSTREAGESDPKETLWRKGNVVIWNR